MADRSESINSSPDQTVPQAAFNDLVELLGTIRGMLVDGRAESEIIGLIDEALPRGVANDMAEA